MKNKVFSLAELRREAKGQKIKFEMIDPIFIARMPATSKKGGHSIK